MSKKITALTLCLAVCCSLFGIIPASALNAGTKVTPSGKNTLSTGFSGSVTWYKLSGNGENDADWVAELAATTSPDYTLINGDMKADSKGYMDPTHNGNYSSSQSNYGEYMKLCDADNDKHKDSWYSAQTLTETIDTYSDENRTTLVSSVTDQRIRNPRNSSFAFISGSTAYGYDSQGAYYYGSDLAKKRPESNPELPYAYEDFVYEFSAGTKISDVLFGGQYSDNSLRSANYKLYVGSNKATLFNDSNMVYHYVNDNASVETNLQHYHFDEAISVAFVGIRILDPIAKPRGIASYVQCSRASVFQIYGETGLTITGGTGVANYNNAITTSRSLILYKKTSKKIEFNSKDSSDSSFDISDPNVAGYEGLGGEFSLTNISYQERDALWGSHDVSFIEEVGGERKIIDDETRQYIQANYAFDALAKVSKVGIYGHNTNDLTPYHFKLSFANNESDLFSSNSTTYDIYNNNAYHYMVITLPKVVQAKYFGIRMICGVMPAAVNRGSSFISAAYGRIGHITVEGVYAEPLAGAVSATSDIAEAPATVTYNGVADKNGKYTSGATATLSIAKTEITIGATGYKFKGWYDGETLVSANATHTVDITNQIKNYVAKFETSVAKHTIEFLGRDGDKVYETYVANGEKIPADELEKALKAANKYYGYLPAGWDSSVSELVVSKNDSINVVYKRNTELACAVTYNGEKVNADGFDAKLTLNADGEKLWKINGEKYSIGASSVIYTCGDMAITTEALGNLDKNKPFVSIINTKVVNGDLIVFATVYEGNETIDTLGVKFTSGVNVAIEDKEWTPIVLSSISYAEASVKDAELMAVLQNTKKGKTRLVQAYALLNSGLTVFSETKTIVI